MDGDSMDVDGSSYLENNPVAHTFPPQQRVQPAAARSSQPLLGLSNLGREAAKPHNKRSFENMSTENEQQQKPKWVQRGDALGHSSMYVSHLLRAPIHYAAKINSADTL